MNFLYVISITIISSLLIPALSFGEDVFLLTRQLQLSSSEDLMASRSFSVTNKLTLFKKLSEENGVTKLRVIQHNGSPSQEIVYASSKWFAKGTEVKDLASFQIDPNTIIDNFEQSLAKKDCSPDGSLPPVQTDNSADSLDDKSCDILETDKTVLTKDLTNEQQEDAYLSCFNNIKKRLKISTRNGAYRSLAKLYTLPKLEQQFMARLLTIYGEASGAIPPEEQMAAVLQVIENRTRYAQINYPDANELDVVLQNSQFSMYIPNDANWKRALTAKNEQLKKAIHVLANQEKYLVKNPDKKPDPKNIYHFVTSKLCMNNQQPDWTPQCQKALSIRVNNIALNSENGHTFFANIPWSFNPMNRYKRYAVKHELAE